MNIHSLIYLYLRQYMCMRVSYIIMCIPCDPITLTVLTFYVYEPKSLNYKTDLYPKSISNHVNQEPYWVEALVVARCVFVDSVIKSQASFCSADEQRWTNLETVGFSNNTKGKNMQTQTSTSVSVVYTSDVHVTSTFNVNSLCRGLKVHSLNPHVSVPVSSRESPIFKTSLRKPGFINEKRVNSKHKYHLLPTPHGLASRPNVNDSFLWHASLHQFS